LDAASSNKPGQHDKAARRIPKLTVLLRGGNPIQHSQHCAGMTGHSEAHQVWRKSGRTLGRFSFSPGVAAAACCGRPRREVFRETFRQRRQCCCGEGKATRDVTPQRCGRLLRGAVLEVRTARPNAERNGHAVGCHLWSIRVGLTRRGKYYSHQCGSGEDL
jgi:hypothetical protein